MLRKFTLLFFIILFAMVCSSFAQTKVAVGYNFDTADSLLAEFGAIRAIAYDDDLLGDGVSGIAATNYNEAGVIHVFRTVGDDEIELVWTSAPYQTYVPGTYNPYANNPRHVVFGDLDNDGRKEVIFHRCHVGLEIWEWDGVAGSYNFGTMPSQTIAPPVIATRGLGTEYCEFLDVGDYDNDGYQELSIAYNGSLNANDNYYVIQGFGNWNTNDPGFSSFRVEWTLNRSADLPYSYTGFGGSPIAMFGCDLDGDSDKDLIITNWNNFNLTTLTTVDKNTYQYADTLSGKSHIEVTAPLDKVALMGGMAFDVDNDGREEAYLPVYSGSGGWASKAVMVHYGAGEATTEIDTNNIFILDMESTAGGLAKSTFGHGYGDIDGDGKPNLYFGQSYKTNVITAEFIGGDKTDPANWTAEVLYPGDSTIYDAIDITVDSAAVAAGTEGDTNVTVCPAFVSNMWGKYTDFDKDGFEDIILPYMTVKDSIDITKETWTDSLQIDSTITETITPDTTFIPGEPPDTVITFDTTYTTTYDTSTYWATEEYKVLNDKRWSLRIIEGTVSTGIVAKDLKVITPEDYVLNQNYPNPFNPETTIEFILPVNKRISLTVYNALGQKIKKLVDNQFLKAGRYEEVWNATNEAGNKVATGMYIYTLKYGNFSKNKKMMLVK